jgi:2-ketoarginine methyltransferase
VSSSFEGKLIEAMQPIRYHALATCLYHLFDTGLFETLANTHGLSIAHLASQHGLDQSRLEAFMKYLQVEDIVEEEEGLFRLSSKGKSFSEFQGWYTVFIGGYCNTFLQIGEKLQQGAGWASRDAAKVGTGSCGMSYYSAIPLTGRLMAEIPHGYHRLLDLGCGNGLYLVEFCKAFPEIEAWGVEPSEGGYQDAVELVRQHGLEGRIRLSCDTASGFLHSDVEYEPDFVVLGFILHEILGQTGEEGVITFLNELFNRFPHIYLIVIEVDRQLENPRIMHHGLSLAYYNPYYLLHSFTQQELQKQAYWEQLFTKCNLEVLKKEAVSPQVDSTGLELGYLIRKRT